MSASFFAAGVPSNFSFTPGAQVKTVGTETLERPFFLSPSATFSVHSLSWASERWGHPTKHRAGFKEMISDALNGKIDLIITKSVSRFARNTYDCVDTVRKLKMLGADVIFEKENINTGTKTNRTKKFLSADNIFLNE